MVSNSYRFFGGSAPRGCREDEGRSLGGRSLCNADGPKRMSQLADTDSQPCESGGGAGQILSRLEIERFQEDG
jgi:hypothetical protein